MERQTWQGIELLSPEERRDWQTLVDVRDTVLRRQHARTIERIAIYLNELERFIVANAPEEQV